MKKFIGIGVLSLTPLFALAQTTLGDILATIGDLVNTLIPIAVAIALLFFFWGLAQYILKASDEDGRKAARDTMIWGIIALFVIVSVWGLVQILQDTFNVGSQDTADIPTVEFR
jgi:hypothetical protein